MDAGGRATQGAVAEENKKIRQKALFDSLILTFSLREKGLSILNLMAVVHPSAAENSCNLVHPCQSVFIRGSTALFRLIAAF
jgi:hypothetical protein